MRRARDLVRLSLMEAMATGNVWSPEFLAAFSGVGAGGGDGGGDEIPAQFIRDCLFQIDCEDKKIPGCKSPLCDNPHCEGAGCKAEECKGQNCKGEGCKDDKCEGRRPSPCDEVKKYGLVQRAGLRIKNARIVGYLNLAGLKFERPIEFETCCFTHTVNLANAQLGAIAFDKCQFEDVLQKQDENKIRCKECISKECISKECISKKCIEERYDAEDQTIGRIPFLMKAAQGVNGFGARFAGDVYFRGLRACRLDFQSARIQGTFSFLGCTLLLPEGLEALASPEDVRNRKYLTALDLTDAEAAHLEIKAAYLNGDKNGSGKKQGQGFRKTKIFGTLALTEARFQSIEIKGCTIVGACDSKNTFKIHGSEDVTRRWRSISARALHVESHVLITDFNDTRPCLQSCGSQTFAYRGYV